VTEPATEASSRYPLQGHRILVADDEIVIALDIEATLVDAGAEILGPSTTLAHALKLAERETLSAATLDIRLGRQTTEAVADVLAQRGIPFVFYSGQALPSSMRERWPQAVVIAKPVEPRVILAAVTKLIKQGRPA
jgi:CheY-like chemotaxis protein